MTSMESRDHATTACRVAVAVEFELLANAKPGEETAALEVAVDSDNVEDDDESGGELGVRPWEAWEL